MIEKNIREGLHRIVNGVFVVAAEYRGQLRGFTATWVSQVSFENPLVIASVDKSHDTYPLIVGSGSFTANVLGASQANIARHFGREKREDDRGDVQYFRQEEGRVVPILNDAVAALVCSVVSTHDVEDHTIFVGQVVEAYVFRDEAPLIFWPRRGYARPQGIGNRE